jgi:hypothetical protein
MNANETPKQPTPAALAPVTGSTFPPLKLSDDPKRLLYEVAGYLETLRMERGRAVRDVTEVLGYWQTTNWLLGLKQLGEHCGAVSGLTPEQYMSNNELTGGAEPSRPATG